MVMLVEELKDDYMVHIKELVKKVFPQLRCLYRCLQKGKFKIVKRYLIYTAPTKQLKKIQSLKDKRIIRCVIMVHAANTFRDSVYQSLVKSGRFEVYLVACPDCGHGVENMVRWINATYEYLKGKGYPNVIMGYDVNRNEIYEIKRNLEPDVVFFSSPYRSYIGEINYITKMRDCLCIYIPYYYNNTVEYKMAYDELLHNIVWRYYVETNWHKEMSKKYSSNNARNVVVTGYPGVDKFYDKQYIPSDDNWRIKDKKHKRIIWAPHQTINPKKEMYYSAFLLIAEDMIELAEKYKDYIQIAFKPHPLLFNTLSKEWGKERTETYYEKWRSMENTSIVDGEYVDLFLTSDAIIHDSASFITEYLMLNKPALRTCNGRDLKTQFNEFSLACLNCYYMAYNGNDIETFIKNVIDGRDPMLEKRTTFIKDHLLPPNDRLSSENIVNDILDSIDNQILYHN